MLPALATTAVTLITEQHLGFPALLARLGGKP